MSGRRYYILYIDDFSRYTWVCFLRSKSSSEVCTVFRDFKNLVELQLKHCITRFRCDNGKGEYDNKAFRSILTEHGITYEPSPPYTQHKNGVSERMIRRTIQRLAQCYWTVLSHQACGQKRFPQRTTCALGARPQRTTASLLMKSSSEDNRKLAIYDVLDAQLSNDSQPSTSASSAHVLTLY